MIKNDDIKSIKSFNNYILLTIYPESRMKLSGFAFTLDEKEFNSVFYSEKGYLELFNFRAVEKFIEANSKHLNEEVQKSILEDAQNHFNGNTTNVTNRRLSFFYTNKKEKIPLAKLEKLKEWAQENSIPNGIPRVFQEFQNIFDILYPPEKRRKSPDSFLYEVFESEGKIEIESLKNAIGKAWSQYYKFHQFMYKAINYPGNNLKRIAVEPELLGPGWDILNKERFAVVLSEWLSSILKTKINPVSQQELSLEELEQLQPKIIFIQDALNGLPKAEINAPTLNL